MHLRILGNIPLVINCTWLNYNSCSQQLFWLLFRSFVLRMILWGYSIYFRGLHFSAVIYSVFSFPISDIASKVQQIFLPYIQPLWLTVRVCKFLLRGLEVTHWLCVGRGPRSLGETTSTTTYSTLRTTRPSLNTTAGRIMSNKMPW